jgi:hypothetical protein
MLVAAAVAVVVVVGVGVLAVEAWVQQCAGSLLVPQQPSSRSSSRQLPLLLLQPPVLLLVLQRVRLPLQQPLPSLVALVLRLLLAVVSAVSACPRGSGARWGGS